MGDSDANPGVSRSIRGLLRAARAIDALLERIRTDLSDGLLPQRNDLIAVLNFEPNIETRVASYVYDDTLSLGEYTSVSTNFAAVALQLAQLEDNLVDLRRAVTWSSRYTAFNWWMMRRQTEINVANQIVVPGPGSCREFLIEPVSALATSFRSANSSLHISDEHLDQLERVRILTVSQNDGAAARWHPIALGHELAHLRFNGAWLTGWLAQQTPNEHTKRAIEIAQMAKADPSGKPTDEKWWVVLTSWLVETACDAAALHFYGAAGIEAMATFLSVHSSQENGENHPAPDVRIAAMSATHSSDLDEFDAATSDELQVRERKNAYRQLAVAVRDAVRAELGDSYILDGARDSVKEAALQALEQESAPLSCEWEPSWVHNRPACVEAGLVAALWGSGVSDLIADHEDVQQALKVENRIEHAIDFLQFSHRFETSKSELGVDKPASENALTNVLHVSKSGIRSDTKEEPGSPSHDVRLGRHFIVFRRNGISSLNSLKTAQTRQVQDLVEVGWGQEFVLHPSEMVLAVTLESIHVSDDCTAQVVSRSSLGRMGLLSATAVQVQPGFRGCLTLELVNLASVPLRLSPGQRVAQIVPTPAAGHAAAYEGKYQDQSWKPRFSAGDTDWELGVLSDVAKEPGGSHYPLG